MRSMHAEQIPGDRARLEERHSAELVLIGLEWASALGAATGGLGYYVGNHIVDFVMNLVDWAKLNQKFD